MNEAESIVVTGGAGFIGSAVLWGLNRRGIDNIIVVDNLRSSDKWKNLVNRQYKTYLHRDEFINQIREGKFGELPQSIIHLGACSSTTETDADFLMRNNTDYSKILCEYALEHNIRFINASSAATYGDGANGFDDAPEGIQDLKSLNIYGYSKHLFDLWLLRKKLHEKVASLKFFNVYGPNEYHKESMTSMVYNARNQILKEGVVRLFKSTDPAFEDGGQQRDFVYVKDCVEIILWLLDNPQINGIRNVGTGIARTWNDLAAAVFSSLGKPINIEYIDMPDSLKGKYQNFTQANMDWLRKEHPHFKFHSVEEGVNDYIVNYLENKDPYL